MLYEYEITVPAATAETAKVSQVLKLDQGIIHQVDVIFRAGCRHQVRLAINRAHSQIIPTNPDGYLTGDWWPITGNVFYSLNQPPYQLEAYGWAPDTSYSHTVLIRIWLARREDLEPVQETDPILARLGRLFLGRGRADAS